MTRCLNERALVRLYFKEGPANEHSHLRLCADCAEAYDRLVEDLEAIHATLTDVPPPRPVAIRLALWPRGLVPAAVALVGIAAVLGVVWRRPPAPIQVAADTRSVSAFATAIATAVFSGANGDEVADLGADVSDLHAALDAGQPCTGEAFFNGECGDQVSALLIETD